MFGVLVATAVTVAIIGVLLLSQATYGVGVLAAACLLAIFARIAQAEAQHRTLEQLLRGQPNAPQWAPGGAAWACAACGLFNPPNARACTHCGAAHP